MLEGAQRIADVEIGLAEREMEGEGLVAGSRRVVGEPGLHRRERRVARFELDEVGQRRPRVACVLVELDDAPQVGSRFVELARFGKRRRARHQRLPPVLAAHGDRLVIASESFRRAIEPHQRVAPVDQSHGVVRP